MTPTVSLIFDAALIGLLVASIAYMAVLNGRLKRLRANQGAFKALIEEFTASTEKAERAMATLKRMSDEAGRSLQKHNKTARSLADDLAFLVERGDEIASRLERSVRAGREAAKGDDEASRVPAPAAKSTAKSISESERDLINALKGSQ